MGDLRRPTYSTRGGHLAAPNYFPYFLFGPKAFSLDGGSSRLGHLGGLLLISAFSTSKPLSSCGALPSPKALGSSSTPQSGLNPNPPGSHLPSGATLPCTGL